MPGTDTPVLQWLHLDPQLPEWQRIQMRFPDTPDWERVADEVLIALVEHFETEPSCATSALIHLSDRRPADCQRLARWLLVHPAADRWLQAAARDALDHLIEP